MIKWLKTFFKCKPTSNKYFGRKTPDIFPRRKTSLPALERKLAAARGVENGLTSNKKER